MVLPAEDFLVLAVLGAAAAKPGQPDFRIQFLKGAAEGFHPDDFMELGQALGSRFPRFAMPGFDFFRNEEGAVNLQVQTQPSGKLAGKREGFREMIAGVNEEDRNFRGDAGHEVEESG